MAGTLSDFAPVVHLASVDKAIVSFLIEWLPTYLRKAEALDGRPQGFLARPQAYSTTYDEDDDDVYADKMLPTIYVTSSGFDEWMRDGEKSWSAMCRTSVSVITRARNMPEGRLNGSLYIGTITNLMLDRPALGGIAGGVTPRSERSRPLDDPSNRSRVLTAGMAEYDIFIPNIRKSRGGPLSPDAPPPTDPLPPFPDVEDVEIEWAGYPPGTDPQSPEGAP